MEYVDSMKLRNKKRDKADRLKLRMGLNAPEVQATIAEEEEVKKKDDDMTFKITEHLCRLHKSCRPAAKNLMHVKPR